MPSRQVTIQGVMTWDEPGPPTPGFPSHPIFYPDVDKLARAVLDGLAGVLFGDDAAVVALSATKGYAFEGCAPGVVITVEAVEPGTDEQE